MAVKRIIQNIQEKVSAIILTVIIIVIWRELLKIEDEDHSRF